MTIEDRRGNTDQFPAGLRVLAVDDNPICLKVLETLLRQCQYNVTTTNQAITALKMLRENKDQFDIVISDVHMPDMDGFKLLELVGLEMDLPVIMLSANGETQTVMKGITHGACDYLLKPVRIEQLKNIWQHVIRKRSYEKKSRNGKRFHSNNDSVDDDQKTCPADFDGDHEEADKNEKISKRRKDQIEEYEDDSEDNMQENEDNSNQKKPRVVWTVELHQKFVAAVNQLGVDKAVPKKILDLMNVENITRENVASHLQKYRLYLKRLALAGQQGSMAAALAGRNSYIHMAPFNGYRNYNTIGGSRQLPNITSYQPNIYLGRINTSAGLGVHSFPSQTAQLGGMHKNESSSFSGFGKLQNINALGSHQVASLQGVPMKLEFDGSKQPKIVHEAKSHLTADFSGAGLTAGVHVNSFPTFSNNPTLLQPNKQYSQTGGFGYHSSARVSSSSSNPFDINFQESSQTTHPGGCNNAWQGAVASTERTTSALPIPFNHSRLSPSTNVQNLSSVNLHKESNVLGKCSSSMAGTFQRDPEMNSDVRNQNYLLGGSMIALPSCVAEEPEISRIVGNSGQKRDDAFASNALTRTSSNSSFPNFQLTDTIAQQHVSDYGLCNIRTDGDVIGQATFAAPDLMPSSLVDNSTTDGQQSYKDEYALENAWWQGGPSTGCGFDDLLSSVVKPEFDDIRLVDVDLGCDVYSLDTCIRESYEESYDR